MQQVGTFLTKSRNMKNEYFFSFKKSVQGHYIYISSFREFYCFFFPINLSFSTIDGILRTVLNFQKIEHIQGYVQK